MQRPASSVQLRRPSLWRARSPFAVRTRNARRATARAAAGWTGFLPHTRTPASLCLSTGRVCLGPGERAAAVVWGLLESCSRGLDLRLLQATPEIDARSFACPSSAAHHILPVCLPFLLQPLGANGPARPPSPPSMRSDGPTPTRPSHSSRRSPRATPRRAKSAGLCVHACIISFCVNTSPVGSHADAHPPEPILRRITPFCLPFPRACLSSVLALCPGIDIHPRRTFLFHAAPSLHARLPFQPPPPTFLPSNSPQLPPTQASTPFPTLNASGRVVSPHWPWPSTFSLPAPIWSRPPPRDWLLPSVVGIAVSAAFVLIAARLTSLARAPTPFTAASTLREPTSAAELTSDQPTAPSWAANRASTHGALPPATHPAAAVFFSHPGLSGTAQPSAQR